MFLEITATHFVPQEHWIVSSPGYGKQPTAPPWRYCRSMTLGKGMALQNPSPLNFLEIFWRRTCWEFTLNHEESAHHFDWDFTSVCREDPASCAIPTWHRCIQKSLVRVESRHDRKIAYTLSTKNCWCKRILPSPSMENLPLFIFRSISISTSGFLSSTVTERKGVESYMFSDGDKVKGCITNGFCGVWGAAIIEVFWWRDLENWWIFNKLIKWGASFSESNDSLYFACKY